MNRNVCYPAIITNEDGIFYIGFPDFEEDFYGTYGESMEEALAMGKEYLVLQLEEREGEFPKPSKAEDLRGKLEETQSLVYLSFDYLYEKSLVELSYVKKTLTIPSYLDILAKNSKLNFSQILQKALKKELGIS